MKRVLPIVLAAMCAASTVQADTIFTATLTGDQEVGPVVTDASGTATLVLNDTQDRLTISATVTGVDLDGLQTPDDATDDVVGMHIHAAPAGVNGGIVFGFISPNHDLNGDLVIDPVAGTVFTAWDLNEGNATTLADQLTNLFNEGLYLNVHTNAHGGGEIRGQIVPEPASAALLLGAVPLLFRRR